MNAPELGAILQAALKHHQAGQLPQAETLYTQILASVPNQPDALHLLGVLHTQTDRRISGIELLRRACKANAFVGAFHNNLGNALRESGQLDEAIAEYRRAIELDPNFAEAYNNLGNALGDIRQTAAAIEAYRKAIAINPNLDHTYSNLGVALREVGQQQEAISSLQKALELNPKSAIAYDNLGIALREAGRLQEAIDSHAKAIELQPSSPPAYSNYSIALKDARKYDESVAACKKAIELNPHYAEAFNNLGVTLAEMGSTEDALAAYRQAIAIKPLYSSAITNLGISLGDEGRFAESLVECQRGVKADDRDPRAKFNLGIIELLLGDFENGWRDYEYRWQCPGLLARRSFTQPRWDGSPLEGKTILLYSEQGIGDVIHFSRYVPQIADRGGKIIIECEGQLHRLIRQLRGVESVINVGDALPAFDVQCPILSLPMVFGTRLESIPAPIPYLAAEPALVEEWAARVEDQNAMLKIGLTWAGRPAHRNDRNRTISLQEFAPLGSSRITYYSIQKGTAAAEAEHPPAKLRVLDPTEVLYDWADTAAMIANLDLVITVDTAVAHLAGAMGKPVWVLLPLNPDWRWLTEREDSPWYPTMRLFRQKKVGDWAEVFSRMRLALREFAIQKQKKIMGAKKK